MKSSPTLRMTLGLVLLTTCLLFVAQQLGLMPSEARALVSARAKIAESLALQIAAAAEVNELEIISTTLDALTQRTLDILSAGLRESDGTLLVEVEEHQARWPESAEDRAPGTHIAIPIFKNGSPWATLELRFAPLESVGAIVPWAGPHFSLIVFIALTSFLAFFLFLRRTLRYLDPSSVVPARVKTAMDAMAEGVLILDDDSHIVLANAAFANKVGESLTSLIGRNPSELGWKSWDLTEAKIPAFPWDDAQTQRETQLGVPLSLSTKSKGVRTFTVNAAPIKDSDENYRGTLATFDDVTEVEESNAKLRRMLQLIETSQKRVKQQNKKLRFLATRDALTGCLNRRSFYPRLEEMLDSARDQDGDLVCVMVDIDHFKSVNDRFGHAAGDKVIKSVAQVFLDTLRRNELVCRYGGEEFCMAFPGADIEQGYTIAERLRRTIESREMIDIQGRSAPGVTASFGVSSTTSGAIDSSTLIENADKALYAAKRGGRNRVVRYGDWDSSTNAESDQSEKVAYLRGVRKTPAGVPSTGQHTVPSAPDNKPGAVNRLKSLIRRLQHTVAQRTLELEHHKTHDELTGLPNRLLLWDRVGQAVARAKRYGKPFALIVLNINRFRRVNEWLGYSGGDRLLKEVGERLLKVLRATDSVVRLNSSPTVSRDSADDFTLLLTDLDKIESIAIVAERIIECFTVPIDIDGREIYVTASMGISSYPRDGESPEVLVEKADRAMGNGKLQAGNSYQFYSDYMDKSKGENLRLENDLRRAVADGGLSLHYQPQVELATGRVICMEALLRWQHPELGMIPPDEFIPVAEYTGLINPIGDWVLRKSCQQVKAWQESRGLDVRVAVNVSPIQMKQKTFLSHVVKTLKETGLRPDQLELEVTETTVMEDFDAAIFILRKLRELGVYTAIDDFGIGYSSLSYIRRFPVTTVKIDRSFIRDLEADANSIAIVSAIVKMAHELKLAVVAEGVETPEQVARLIDARCDLIQGFLFSRPVPAEQASELISTDARSKPWWPADPRVLALQHPA